MLRFSVDRNLRVFSVPSLGTVGPAEYVTGGFLSSGPEAVDFRRFGAQSNRTDQGFDPTRYTVLVAPQISFGDDHLSLFREMLLHHDDESNVVGFTSRPPTSEECVC